MDRIWHKAFRSAALALMLTAPLSGCVARPAPRPAPAGTIGSIDRDLSIAVTNTALAVPGAGHAEAIVMGNTALVGIQLDNAQPGGTQGMGLTGDSNDPDYQGTSPGGGPPYLQGPGGSTGSSTAGWGGGIVPGGVTPGTGSSPSSTQALNNSSGGDEVEFGSNDSPQSNPSAVGSAPLDVMQRIADQIKAKHPQITTVRFVTRQADAVRLDRIAREIHDRSNPQDYQAEVNVMTSRALPAGTTLFNPIHVGPGNKAVLPGTP